MFGAIRDLFRALFNCTRRQLDAEIDRRIEAHDEAKAPATSAPPITINITNQPVSPPRTPPVNRSPKINQADFTRFKSSPV
jgi:hypothetical protein